MSKIEQELLEATGLKAKKNEDRQVYLVRLMRAVAKLEDSVWEGLSTEAQEWNNGAAENHKAGAAVDDFPDAELAEEAPVADEEVNEEAAPPTPKAAAKKPEKVKEAAKPTNGSGRKVSACHTIKKMVAKNPTITVADIASQLQESGLKVSDVTIATLRSDLRDTLRVLNELGIGKFTL